MKLLTHATLALAIVASSARAQNEAALRSAFEGKLVTVKIDMPGPSEGVDVYPGAQMPVDFRKVADRVKKNGTSLKMGQQVMVTKVVVKKNDHIEFQLAGGGYGTFGDNISSPSNVYTSSEGETREERAIKDSIKAAKGPTKRKQFERDLANMRAERERENEKAKAEAAQANAANEANLREKRLAGGSRFNIRYKEGIPPESLTPDGVMKALGEYIDFTATAGTVAASAAAVLPSKPNANASSTGSGLSGLKKGLSLKEVEALLGPAVTAKEEKEGSVSVMKRTYHHSGMKVSASFVSEVLVDFAITPA
jgi:hypothetical protein